MWNSASWTWMTVSFTKLRMFVAIISSNWFSILFSLLFLELLWCKYLYAWHCPRGRLKLPLLFPFYFTGWVISITLCVRFLIHSSVSSDLLIPSSVIILTSVIVFFNSDWFFKNIFYLLRFWLSSPILLLSLVNTVMTITLNLLLLLNLLLWTITYLVKFLISILVSAFSNVLSWKHCFHFALFSLLGILAPYLVLEEWPHCRTRLLGPSGIILSDHQSWVLQGMPCMTCVHPSTYTEPHLL